MYNQRCDNTQYISNLAKVVVLADKKLIIKPNRIYEYKSRNSRVL